MAAKWILSNPKEPEGPILRIKVCYYVIMSFVSRSGLVDCWWKHFSCKMVTSRLPAAPKRSSTDSSCGDIVWSFQTNQKCFFKKRRRWINNIQMELICGRLLAGATDKTFQNINIEKKKVEVTSTSCLRCPPPLYDPHFEMLGWDSQGVEMITTWKNQLLLTRWQTH